MKTALFVILLLFNQTVSAQNWRHAVDSFHLQTLNERKSLSQALKKSNTVFIFFSTDCPLSQKYTLTLQNIFNEYQSYIDFIGVFPGQEDEKEKYKKFQKTYPVPYELVWDKQLKLTRFLGATTTPEVFLVSQNGKILYHGAVDDGVISLGSSRKVVTKHYLIDAISQTLKKETVNIPFVKPVGCFIEK